MSCVSRCAWFLVCALVAFSAASCAAKTTQLYQVSGDRFSFGPPPAQDDFRYGPFTGLSREARFQRLLALWQARLAAQHVPGGAIAVVMDGELAFSGAVGVLKAGTSEPVRAESRFRTASISKMLIAATILTMVEHDGLLLDHPLTEFVPYFRRGAGFDASQVTLQMLLNHTGGIPDSQSPPKLFGLRPIIEAHAEDPLWSPPGRLFNYSNADYALLAAVIAERTGRRFEDVVSERVMRPSGMRTASYDADGHGLAAGHDAAGRVVWTRPRESEAARAAGGVIASVIDYAHFAEKLLAHGGGVLTSSSVDAMMTGHALMQAQPQQLYGYGLYETEQAGLHIVEHAGSAAGFSTLVRLVPSRNFAVMAFDNGSHPPDEVVDAATSAFLDVPEAPRARVLTPPSTWAKYTGSYVDPTGALGEFDVVLKNDKLWFVPHEGKRGQVTHNLRGSFEAGADGSIEYFVTRVGVARKRTELLSSAERR